MQSIAVSPVLPGGTVLIAAAASGHSGVAVWDADSLASISTLVVDHGSAVHCVAFGPCAPGLPSVLATGGWDGVVRLWALDGGSPVGAPLVAHTAPVSGLAFSSPVPGSPGHPPRLYLASCSHDKSVRVWDVGAGRPLGTPLMGHCDAVECVAFGPVSDNWYVGSPRLSLWVSGLLPAASPCLGRCCVRAR